ncbi:MAG: nuclear transport factor 2 family protein [Candidatus Thorarchaeota archaeon]
MIEEMEKVRETVTTYLEAVKHKDWNKFQESWHPEARMSFVRDGEVHSVPRSFWQDWCKSPIDLEEKRTSSIASIDVTGNIAASKVVVLRETPDERMILTDYLTLLQDNDKWLIISKSYTSNVF